MKFNKNNFDIQNGRGFTLIEMVIIAPIVILSIGAFIVLIVNMTGEVMSSRGSNALAYELQDTLNRIEQDVKLSSTFLAQNSISFSAANPQGKGAVGSVDNFVNVTSSGEKSLILASIATNSNPVSDGVGSIYLKDMPNNCSDPLLYKKNKPLVINIIYFIDNKGDSDPSNDTLYRRTVMPTNYATADDLCGGTVWQQPSCQAGYSSSFCKTEDVKLLEGVAVGDLSISYYTSASSSSPNVTASSAYSSVSSREQALSGIQTVEVSISAKRKVAGRDISRTGSLRVTRLDANATSIANNQGESVTGKTPVVSSKVVDGSDVLFEWQQLSGAVSYSIDYRIDGGSWVVGAASLSNSQRSYKVASSYSGAIVEARVRATDAASGLSNYGNNTMNVPLSAPLQLTNGWVTYGQPYAAPSYSITSSGLVVLSGLMKGGSLGAFATLPEKYRPGSGNLMFMTSSHNNTVSRLDVRNDGTILQQSGTGGWATLDGVAYMPGSTGFTEITSFANGWRNYSPLTGAGWPNAAYKVDASGRVYLRGLLGAGTNTSGTNMFTLPAALMPSEYHHVLNLAASTSAHIGINPSANAVQVKGGSNLHHSIQAIYFPAGVRSNGTNCDTQWCDLPLINGWTFYGGAYTTPQYTKASDGMVHIKGLIRYGSLGHVTGILPDAYCPRDRLLVTTVSLNTWGRLDVVPQTGGGCRIEANPVNNGWVSLDALSYYAGK